MSFTRGEQLANAQHLLWILNVDASGTAAASHFERGLAVAVGWSKCG